MVGSLRRMAGLTFLIVATMAFLISSQAAATTTALCTSHDSLTCSAEHTYTGHIEAVASGFLWTSSFWHLECESSSISGTALGLASPLIVHTEQLTFEGCSNSVQVLDETGFLLILKTGLNVFSGSAHGLRWLVETAGIDCEYAGVVSGGLTGDGSTGKALARIVVNEAELTKVGGNFFCPSQTFATATYEIQLPHSIHVLQ